MSKFSYFILALNYFKIGTGNYKTFVFIFLLFTEPVEVTIHGHITYTLYMDTAYIHIYGYKTNIYILVVFYFVYFLYDFLIVSTGTGNMNQHYNN